VALAEDDAGKTPCGSIDDLDNIDAAVPLDTAGLLIIEPPAGGSIL